MIEAAQVVALYHTRKNRRSPMLEKRLEVLNQYNGETRVVLPELDQTNKPSVANLLNLGIDQFAQRIASQMPDVNYPSLRPGVVAWDDKARMSRMANIGWWDMNRMQLLDYKRARFLLAFAGARGKVYEQIRRDGVIELVGDRVPELVGISAPVFGADGVLVGALTLTMPAHRRRSLTMRPLAPSSSTRQPESSR